MLTDNAVSELVENMKIIFLGPIKKAEELLKGEVPILCHICETGKATPTELARKYSLSTARIATILNRLEDKELIVRVHDNKDRRKVFIYLTDKGKDFATVKINALHQHMNDLLNMLGEEDSKEYLRLTSKVAAYMKQQL